MDISCVLFLHCFRKCLSTKTKRYKRWGRSVPPISSPSTYPLSVSAPLFCHVQVHLFSVLIEPPFSRYPFSPHSHCLSAVYHCVCFGAISVLLCLLEFVVVVFALFLYYIFLFLLELLISVCVLGFNTCQTVKVKKFRSKFCIVKYKYLYY